MEDEDEYPEPPTLTEDPCSPRVLFETARDLLRFQVFDEATRKLETAVSVLPEYTDALSLLWGQLLRQGRTKEALAVGLRAIKSPPSFGDRAVRILSWLQSQPTTHEVEDDPVWQNRHRLKLCYGGVKENNDYAIYLAAIDAYLGASQYVEASVLMQTYAELMYRETVSFQERNGFDLVSFRTWQIDISAKLPYGPRIFFGEGGV